MEGVAEGVKGGCGRRWKGVGVDRTGGWSCSPR